MATTSSNLVQGPADLYTATFGATEPADSAVASVPSASTWHDVGGTLEGTTLTVTQEYAELVVDQLVDIPERRLTKRELTVASRMAEPTLDNFILALNGGTVTASAAYSSYDPDTASSVTQPTYKALMVDGWAPGTAMRRRLITRKALSVEAIETAWKKEDQSALSVTWASHYVSSVIKPFRLVDQLT
ncbi:MAG TPA: hypothetical protein VIU37_04590 [Candidatus Limnocylindrales bacterium]